MFSALLQITSLGFFIDSNRVNHDETLEYEVYALKREGHYIASDRGVDYRGEQNLGDWDLLSAGNLSKTDLETDPGVVAPGLRLFFRIPFAQFVPARVPPNGRLRAFYVATKSSGLIYANPQPATLVLRPGAGLSVEDSKAPQLLVGEGIAMYPMPDLHLYYTEKSFLGKVYYEKECASLAPSVSGACCEGRLTMASF